MSHALCFSKKCKVVGWRTSMPLSDDWPTFENSQSSLRASRRFHLDATKITFASSFPGLSPVSHQINFANAKAKIIKMVQEAWKLYLFFWICNNCSVSGTTSLCSVLVKLSDLLDFFVWGKFLDKSSSLLNSSFQCFLGGVPFWFGKLYLFSFSF